MWTTMIAALLLSAGKPVPPDSWTQPYLGTWDVALTAVMSSCPDRSALGVTTSRERWVLTASGADIRVAVRDAATPITSYSGLYAGSKQELLLDDGSRATAQLAGTPQKLEGQLLQIQERKGAPCAVLFHVSASRGP